MYRRSLALPVRLGPSLPLRVPMDRTLSVAVRIAPPMRYKYFMDRRRYAVSDRRTLLGPKSIGRLDRPSKCNSSV